MIPIELLSPSLSEIISLFGGLSKIDPDLLAKFLQYVDSGMLKKMSLWSGSLIDHLSKMNLPDASPYQVSDPKYDSDYLKVMNATKYEGPSINFEDVEKATRVLTEAVKAKNYIAGAMVGISLGKMMV